MSPGATFERVYNELKRMLAEGELPPGSPIEPALIGKQIASSITPIRDALHRLTGEWLVEAPNHNGFRVPLLTEAALRDLYEWNGQLVGLAARQIRTPMEANTGLDLGSEKGVATATATLFTGIARVGGSREHSRAIQHLNDRLAPYRHFEARILDKLHAEIGLLVLRQSQGDRMGLIRLLVQYHRRRVRIVPALLVEAQS